MSYHDVLDFCSAMGQKIGDPAKPGMDRETALLRARLVLEEAIELCQALGLARDQTMAYAFDHVRRTGAKHAWTDHQVAADPVALADACADLRYVVHGTEIAAGLSAATMQAIDDRVHAANMAKVAGPVDEHGKKLKPPGWMPPDIAGPIDGQVARHTHWWIELDRDAGGGAVLEMATGAWLAEIQDDGTWQAYAPDGDQIGGCTDPTRDIEAAKAAAYAAVPWAEWHRALLEEEA